MLSFSDPGIVLSSLLLKLCIICSSVRLVQVRFWQLQLLEHPFLLALFQHAVLVALFKHSFLVVLTAQFSFLYCADPVSTALTFFFFCVLSFKFQPKKQEYRSSFRFQPKRQGYRSLFRFQPRRQGYRSSFKFQPKRQGFRLLFQYYLFSPLFPSRKFFPVSFSPNGVLFHCPLKRVS